MSNYPAGFTQGEHDRTFGANPNEDRMGNEEDCTLCHRAFVQDTFDRRFYYADDVELYGFQHLSYSKSIDPFEFQGGWICSESCWNDRVALNEDEGPHTSDCNVWVKEPCSCITGGGVALNEDESIPARPVLHLVKGGRA
jgi:hypothetical protein